MTTPENERGTMGGNATTSWRVEVQQHIERMSGKGSATRSDVTASQDKREANGSGGWRRCVERQQRAKRTSCRGRATRGVTTISQHIKRNGCRLRGWVAKAAQQEAT
jgi:hypothetical protein